MDSEFYTGWLTHWGEAMANTSAVALATDTDVLLRWANNSGNLNFYMIHGGTNFGFWAGANVESDGTYMPTITSYDYSSPISEAGDYCQPGIGGDCKYTAVRAVIAAYLGQEPPPAPPPPVIRAYGAVEMYPVGPLMAAAGPAVVSEVPLPMEEYGQRWGLIIYRHRLAASLLVEGEGLLDLGLDVHDYATVLVNGAQVGTLERSGPAQIVLPAASAGEGGDITLDIIVQAMGRQNFGCDAFGAWDRKGLVSRDVRLNGKLINWVGKFFTILFSFQRRLCCLRLVTTCF
jgi:beta-galactosidase